MGVVGKGVEPFQGLEGPFPDLLQDHDVGVAVADLARYEVETVVSEAHVVGEDSQPSRVETPTFALPMPTIPMVPSGSAVPTIVPPPMVK